MGKKGRPPKYRSPEEEKRLSYERDCRPSYGNSDKAARKAIPLRKAIENRQDRRRASQALGKFTAVDDEKADLIESSARQDVYRVGGWRKGPDTPLGQCVKYQKETRQARIGGKARRAERQLAFRKLLDSKT